MMGIFAPKSSNERVDTFLYIIIIQSIAKKHFEKHVKQVKAQISDINSLKINTSPES